MVSVVAVVVAVAVAVAIVVIVAAEDSSTKSPVNDRKNNKLLTVAIDNKLCYRRLRILFKKYKCDLLLHVFSSENRHCNTYSWYVAII